MVLKKVKEHSNRQRINLNKGDGFSDEEPVEVISKSDFDDIKSEILRLQDKLSVVTTENEMLKKQENNLTEMMDKLTIPIYENHQKELDKKEVEIKRLNDELSALRKIASQFAIDINGLSAIDIFFRNKQKGLIDDFNNAIWISGKKELTDTKKIEDSKK